jgi:HEAT repeat protein
VWSGPALAEGGPSLGFRLPEERGIKGRLTDPDPSVRRAAAWALAALRSAAAGSALHTAMSTDADAWVRRAAEAAFRR